VVQHDEGIAEPASALVAAVGGYVNNLKGRGCEEHATTPLARV